MPESNCVIIGKDNQDHDEKLVAYLRAPEGGDSNSSGWFAWIRDAHNGPQISVRREAGQILITESIEGGGRIYTYFEKPIKGAWTYSTGVVIDMTHGWMTQGSSISRGKVVFDSSNILDRALISIQKRN